MTENIEEIPKVIKEAFEKIDETAWEELSKVLGKAIKERMSEENLRDLLKIKR